MRAAPASRSWWRPQLPRAVAAAAEAAGWPVPEGDIVAPNMANPTPFGDAARALARRITAGSTASEAPNAAAAEAASAAEAAIEDIEHALPVETEPADAEPIPLDAEGAATLRSPHGGVDHRRLQATSASRSRWRSPSCAARCPWTRCAPPRCRTPAWAWWCSSPGADMPIMTLNQAKMLLQIAAAYGQPLSARSA